MTKYQVCIDSIVVWEGSADTGIDALREAREANPDIDESAFYVNTV